MNQFWYIITLKSIDYSDFFNFHQCSFSIARFHPGYPITFMSPWVFLGCDNFSDYIVFENLDSFEVCYPVRYCGMSLNQGLSDVFLMIRTRLWILDGKDQTGKMTFSSHCSKGTWYQYDLWLLVLTSITWLK